MIPKLSRIRRAVRNPVILRRKLGIVASRPFVTPSDEEISFLAEDWDTLVILDACRYDLMADVDPFGQPVSCVHSNATQTREFLRRNFGDGEYPGLVYVSASPQLTAIEAEFAYVDHVWQSDWNDDLDTVLPAAVTDHALAAHREYPNKRLIVHYMQPHYPFIGETGREIESQASFQIAPDGISVWEQLQSGIVSEAQVATAYRENLELAVDDVNRLIDGLDGKTVVTSDHGNLYGKRVSPLPFKIYGHPARLHDPELTAVPWIEFPYESRRKIIEGSSRTHTGGETTDVTDRLESLGYR